MFKKISITILLAILISASIGLYKFDSALNESLAIKQEQFLTIKAGSSINAFANLLVDKKWLDNTFWLKVYGRLFPSKVNIKAGTYLIKQDITLTELISVVVEGKEHQFSITLIEGTRFSDALDQVKKHPEIKQTLQGKTIVEIAKLLKIASPNPEGWLFPDTYAFTAGTLDIDILKRAYTTMREQLTDLWLQKADDLPYKTAYEALIMASIIEKETSYIAEQPLISSVFVNRLNKKMRLQTDPTVIYGLGDRYKGDITRAHLREKTRYNTYRIDGLPPTPIALAGLSAIKATLHPQTSQYYYFVSGGNGRHVFSKTLAAHNKAVRQYLKQQKQANKNK